MIISAFLQQVKHPFHVLLAGFSSVLICAHYAQADTAHFTPIAPLIDANIDEAAWHSATWYPIDQAILGELPDKADFSGRYALSWTKDALYIAAVITDDVLYDQFANPLEGYWNDDCLEIFVDEDASGGDHLNNFNAFAYHVALDNQVVDIAPAGDTGKPALFNDHIDSQWRRMSEPPYDVVWELKVNLYDSGYRHVDGQAVTPPVTLSAGKTMGFMLSYCDSDSAAGREHFIGSHPIEAVNGDKNRGYIDASVFDTVTLLPTTN